MPEIDIKPTCCECQHNKCNKEKDSKLADLLFWITLFGAIYLYGRYILRGLEGNGHENVQNR